MTDERAKHQCHVPGCDSEALYGTKIMLDVVAPGVRYPIRMNCTIAVCEKHKVEANVRAYVLNDKNRETIHTSLVDHGHPEPDWLSTRILFEPKALDHAALLATPPAMCVCDGCKAPARWQVKQRFRMFWQKGRGDPQVEALTNITLCEAHKAQTTRHQFMDKESLSSTRAWLNSRGVSMPDLKTMEIAFVPIDGRKIEPRVFVGENGPRDQFEVKL